MMPAPGTVTALGTLRVRDGYRAPKGTPSGAGRRGRLQRALVPLGGHRGPRPESGEYQVDHGGRRHVDVYDPNLTFPDVIDRGGALLVTRQVTTHDALAEHHDRGGTGVVG